MDETKLRAIIREEIALAMKTLGDVASNAAPSLQAEGREGESGGSLAIASAAGVYFTSAYEANCAVADDQRAQDAENPFAEKAPDATTEALRDVLASLRKRGAGPDHIARVEKLVKDRERPEPE